MANDIDDMLQYVLARVDVVDDLITVDTLSACAKRLAEASLDFNDMVIEALCLAEGAFLLTNDANFAAAHCAVLTT